MQMKRIMLVWGIVVCALLMAYPCYANINQFVGHWHNSDPNTKGITQLQITVQGNNVFVHAWGKCHPQDCDWKAVPGYAYADNVSQNVMAGALAVTAFYKTGFSETIIVLHAARNQLRANTFTRFTDNRGRSNYTEVYTFKKAPSGLTAPVQVSPANGTAFNNYPRHTTLVWRAVQGAAHYGVEVDCFGCCQAGKWCTDVRKKYLIVPSVNATQHAFDFVGAQPGRWRVWAIDAQGQAGPKSPWWESKYTR
jgi:hypothetical protein